MDKQKRVILSQIKSHVKVHYPTDLEPKEKESVTKAAPKIPLEGVPILLKLLHESKSFASVPKLEGIGFSESRRVKPLNNLHYTFTSPFVKKSSLKPRTSISTRRNQLSNEDITQLLLDNRLSPGRPMTKSCKSQAMLWADARTRIKSAYSTRRPSKAKKLELEKLHISVKGNPIYPVENRPNHFAARKVSENPDKTRVYRSFSRPSTFGGTALNNHSKRIPIDPSIIKIFHQKKLLVTPVVSSSKLRDNFITRSETVKNKKTSKELLELQQKLKADPSHSSKLIKEFVRKHAELHIKDEKTVEELLASDSYFAVQEKLLHSAKKTPYRGRSYVSTNSIKHQSASHKKRISVDGIQFNPVRKFSPAKGKAKVKKIKEYIDSASSEKANKHKQKLMLENIILKRSEVKLPFKNNEAYWSKKFESVQKTKAYTEIVTDQAWANP